MLKKEGNSFSLGRFGDMPVFLDIVLEQYRVYSDFHKEKGNLDQMADEEVLRLNRKQIDPLYISTVFSAMFLEAYIFDYGARKCSAKFMTKHLDKLAPGSKWLITTQMFNEKGLESSHQAYKGIVELFAARNQLVHSRTEEFHGIESVKKSSVAALYPQNCLKLIWDVMTELKQVDKDEIYAQIVIEKIDDVLANYPAPQRA
jgi:hypothetical protein